MNKRCGTSSLSAHDIYRWEKERRTPDQYLEDIAAVLELEVERLLVLTRGTLPGGGAPPQPAHLTEPEDDVDRREFSGAVAGAFAAVSLSAAPAQARSRGRQIGMSDVNRNRHRIADLRRLDDYTGGAHTHSLAEAHVAELERMLKFDSYSQPVHTELLSTLAEAGQFAAWTAFDSGLLDVARKMAQKATRAANQAGNRLLAASTLSELSYLTASSSNPKEATAIARAAWTNAPRDALPAARVVFADRWAYACARVGDARGVDRALGLSADAHNERDSRHDPEPDWVYWINRDESLIMEGRCWAELRMHTRAIPVLEKVTAPYDDTHAREVALFECWRAGSYLDAGEVEQATGAMSRAVDLTGSTQSPRTDRWVGGVLQRLKQHQDVAPVRDLLERTATV
ncbi:XRE family transcriptional regulator [Streptomyces solisilvae]|uniref:XRE family transcriptional regulator n=1 Tax=Streptomyces malaysiensis TaxID=92644 RepID=UPI00367E3202